MSAGAQWKQDDERIIGLPVVLQLFYISHQQVVNLLNRHLRTEPVPEQCV